MTLELVPLAQTHLEAAAALLAARHRADRAREPELPARFEEVGAARGAVKSTLDGRNAAGVAAMRGGRMAGYLIATPMFVAPATRDALFAPPRSATVEYAGHAVAADEGGELYREMYAALAPHMLARGCFAHYVEVPAADRATRDTWFSLGFGLEAIRGVRPTTPTTTAGTRDMLATRSDSPLPHRDQPDRVASVPSPQYLEIRRAGPEDLDDVLRLVETLFRHHAASPQFMPFLPEAIAGMREGHGHLLDDPALVHWLACRDGRPVALQRYGPTAPDAAMVTPERCIHLMDASTEAAVRGGGIGTAVLDHAMAWAREAGYDRCTVSWRTANLLAARYWPGRGFHPLRYLLRRNIDERITWARGRLAQRDT